MTITSALFHDEIGGKIKVTWFNAPFMKDAVKPGQLYILRGRVSRKYGVLQLDQPMIDGEGMKPLKIAVEEINRGLLTYDTPVEEEEQN